MSDLRYHERPSLSNNDLNVLFEHAWPNHTSREFTRILERSLVYIAAFDELMLVGFVNVAWDGGVHAFLLDPTVHPDYQRQGVGSELVRRALAAIQASTVEWVHVDFEEHLLPFYRPLGFQSTHAGLLSLQTLLEKRL